MKVCGNNDRWLGHDKRAHFLGSAVLGAGGTLLAAQQMKVEDATLVGFSAAMTAGIGKELYDGGVRQTCFSWKDLFWDFLGASIGATVAASVSD